MSYIRRNKANGREYLEEVESYRNAEQQPRVKVLKKLGRALPDSGIKAAMWSQSHTLGHIAIRENDPVLRFIEKAIEAGTDISTLPCHLIPAGKARNGAEQKWCRTHQQYFGRKTDVHNCCHASIPMDFAVNPVQLDPRLYPGQFALWYALPPAISTKPVKCQQTGIHVHGRVKPGGKKKIDQTFPCVVIGVPCQLLSFDWIVLTPPAAEAWLLATESDTNMVFETCPHCCTPHLDLGYFAAKPHKKHLCGNCGRMFGASSTNISNPLSRLNEMLGGSPPGFEVAPRSLSLNTLDYPGGVEVWASTPAIVWVTKDNRPQQTGIHVHVCDDQGKLTIDETFGEVVLDGTLLKRENLLAMSLPSYTKPVATFTTNSKDLTAH